MIVIIDFGSQTAHLIARRIRDMGISSEIIDPEQALAQIKSLQPNGIIFSGGPTSVFEPGAPTVDKKLFTLGIPVLGICYGWQLMAQLLGGKVAAGQKEYGPAQLTVHDFSDLFYGLPAQSQVFESHGTTVMRVPAGFKVLGSTSDVPYAAVGNSTKHLYGVQFHPEVTHSKKGVHILKNFATRICNLPLKTEKIDIDKIISEIREKVGNRKVIGAFSGGTDSAVAGTLTARAIGKQFIPIYIDSGLMREETLGRIKHDFPAVLGIKVRIINARGEFLAALKDVTEPEAKRKTIGNLYIKLFEHEMSKDPSITFLLQGTTYADFIHSQGTKHSAHIKSHHNVGGLPKDMKLQLLEPLRYYYTDQVRKIGQKAGMPKDMVYQQPFPGPGHAVRIMGEVTKERLAKQVQADTIVVEEMKKSGYYSKVFQCWSIMTGANSTAVKGDGRFYGEIVALRIVTTKDRMSADWARVPYNVLAKLSTRIVNEVPGISRVVYDITTKPPSTMEWE